MTINHIDQLAEWWENAEESDDFYPGDTWIKRTQAQTGGYVYDVGRVTSKKRYYEARVLARAPKPKPAWHDAVAVMARCSNAPEGHREPFIRSEATHDVWTGEGGWARTEDLRDVTPLIEARVTDEMLARVEAAFTDDHGSFNARIRAITAAALGLDPEPAGRSTGPHLHYDAKENA